MLGLPSLLVGTGPLPPKALAELPPSASLPTGTQYEITDYGRNVAIVINGVWRFVAPFRTTWAGRPAVGLVPAGTELQVTDYANQKWISDGTVWRPAQGSVRISGRNGNPLAILSGVAGGVFTLPPITVPAGMLFDGAVVRVESMMKRTTSTAAYSAMAFIGPLGTNADPNMGIVSCSGGTNACTRMSAIANVTTGSIVCSRYTGPHGYDNGAAVVADISLVTDQKVSIGVGFANTADTFHLQSYLVTLEA